MQVVSANQCGRGLLPRRYVARHRVFAYWTATTRLRRIERSRRARSVNPRAREGRDPIPSNHLFPRYKSITFREPPRKKLAATGSRFHGLPINRLHTILGNLPSDRARCYPIPM